MYDLIGTQRRLDRLYRLYIKSAFPLRDPSLKAERDALVALPRMLAQEALLEPMPEYAPSNVDPKVLGTQLGQGFDLMNVIAPALMPGISALYEHQLTAAKAALIDNKDVVVTTGTGSGKTECFLIPLLARITREMSSGRGEPASPAPFWWQEGGSGERLPQKSRSGHREPAMRAIVLYPFNALVEDQLVRLRKTVLAPNVITHLDECCNGDRITFGRYTGSTPVSGSPEDPAATTRLISRLRDMDSGWKATEGLESDVRHFHQNPRGPEAWSRWDMQESPPDILITNYSMLNIMLMRGVEEGMFEQTGDWLRRSKSNTFTLVVDELHSYRGTAGTEVAYILRLLAMRLGLEQDSPQLRILATSASLDESQQSRDFLSGFFGRDGDSFEIVPDPFTAHVSPPKLEGVITDFADFAREVQADIRRPEPKLEVATPILAKLESKVNLSQLRMDQALREACRDDVPANSDSKRRIRATRESILAQRLFGTHPDAHDALRGFLLAGALKLREDNCTPLLRIRGHLFFRTLGNLWACSDPVCTGSARGIGSLSGEAGYGCSRCGSRILDLIVCTCCGEAFLGGYRSEIEGGQVSLTPDAPDLEGAPESGSLRRTVSEYAVYWPTPDLTVEPQRMLARQS